MKKLNTIIAAGVLSVLSATAFACPKGTTLTGGTGTNHKGGKCVATQPVQAHKQSLKSEKTVAKTEAKVAKTEAQKANVSAQKAKAGAEKATQDAHTAQHNAKVAKS